MCVVELSGLEVAVEKVTEVIKTVGKHLFHVNLVICLQEALFSQ